MNLDSLNKAQRQAVVQTEGPLMVLAGAGSGKTRTLVARISYLIGEKKVSPFRLLALTFSNKAAREMRERVSAEVSEDIGALQITTFHAFCARVLRNESQYLGLSRNFTIYDGTESKAVVKTLLSRKGISTKEQSPFEILYFIDELKNNGHYHERKSDYYEANTEDDFYDYYLEYENELHRANAVDFGGLITGVLQLFEKYPDVLKRYQERFQYMLVDEYQDTNRAQFDLLRYLCAATENICVVGDEDQSIYSWRGADINNILDFEKLYPKAELVKLEQNYRSSRNIIEAASHVISRNSMRKGKDMWTENADGECIDIFECHNDKKEGEFITNKIIELNNDGVEYKDIALFYRTNAQSRLIEDYLRRSNLPYKVIGGVKFYERKEIKDLLAYVRVVVNSKDSLALSRIINVPTRGIGATTLRKLEAQALKSNLSLFEVIEAVVDYYEEYKHLRLSAKVRSSLNFLTTLIQDVRLLTESSVAPNVLYEKLLHESGYWDHLKASKDYESMARIENLEELGNAISQYEESQKNATLGGFLESITLDTTSEEDRACPQGEISLMTVHGAKGLEFNYVFLSGAEENVFPSYRALEEGAQAEEEERRLFYVAMTRAMKRLYITFAQGRMLFGQLKFNGPSRFLHEIPEKYYDWSKIGENQDDSGFTSDPDWDDFEQQSHHTYDEGEVVYQVKSQKKEIPSKFPKGSVVIHSLYGQGKVLDTTGSGPEEKVVIKFMDGSKKKFMVRFAPLVMAE